MDTKNLVCQVLSALMELDPDTEMAKLAIEFAQRTDAEDSAAFWTEADLIDRINKAIGEINDFESLNSGKIASQANDLAKSL